MTLGLFFRFLIASAVFYVGLGGSAFAEDRDGAVVNVFYGSGAIAKDTLARFTRETGIAVHYDTNGDAESLNTKLLAGRSGYDVVFTTSAPFFAHQAADGLFRPLDLARIPNAQGIDPAVLDILRHLDPGAVHGLPFLTSAIGIGVNRDMVRAVAADAPLDSWALLFDPKVVRALSACGVSLLDSPGKVFPAVQAWLGRDPRGRTTADLDAALTALTVVRPWVHVEDGRKYRGDLVKGTVCVAQGKIGDLLAVRDRALHGKGPHPDIAVILPKEGGLLGLDVMAIPADAPNPGAAEALMNFLLRPGIIAEVTSEVGRANVVPASLPLIDPAVRSDPLIYPPSDIQDKLFLLASSASREFDRLRTRAWARFRAARH